VSVVVVRAPSTVPVGLVVSAGSCAQAGAASSAHTTIARSAPSNFFART
jgi:hypothetical protein